MKILVCVKEVPDADGPCEIDQAQLWIASSDKFDYRMNRYDEYALEEAVLLKEMFHDVTVDAITVGPDRAAAILKKSLGKGADNGIHVVINAPGYLPPSVIASLIARYAADKAYDLILTGVMAEDDMQCLTGPLLAAKLSMPCAVSVMKTGLNLKERTIAVESEMAGGMREKALLRLPALCTIQSGINRPRYPSLSNVMRAKTQQLITSNPPNDMASVATERMLAIDYPITTRQGRLLQGTIDEKAEELLDILHEKFLL
ncbi:MAG: hypothetical protein QNJ97_26520 [Myxococcota bacterium]|nr:hypothetical protein [Myxococcota bacterium]